MPSVISSAIVNSPPPEALADLLNKRNKVHHLDADTDEDMIPIFTHDVNGKPRNNKRLLNRRNWCSIRQYDPELSPPPTPQTDGPPSPPPRGGIMRRLSSRGPSYRPESSAPPPGTGVFRRRQTSGPPISSPGFFARRGSTSRRASTSSERPASVLSRTLSLTRKDFVPANLFRRTSKRRKPDSGGINGYGASSDEEDSYTSSPKAYRSGLRGGSGGHSPNMDEGYFPAMPAPTARVATNPISQAPTSVAGSDVQQGLQRMRFHRTPTGMSAKQLKKMPQNVNLEGGLDVCLNMEINPKDPAGITMPYRLLVPRLWHEEPPARVGGSREGDRDRSEDRGSFESDSERSERAAQGKRSRWKKFAGKGGREREV